MTQLCLQTIQTRSAYTAIQPHLCQRLIGHNGPHAEYHYLAQLKRDHRAIAEKIKRDATMTTGASWKSEEAGPNRILRWVMLLSDEDLLTYNINMPRLQPQVVAKLRDKAARYEDCVAVAKKLTWLTYQMLGAPLAEPEIAQYLEDHFGPMQKSTTVCIVCREQLPFAFFALARRGKAEIETGHMSPREHNAENVGFAHRECNIAQGNKTLEEFYDWIQSILQRVALSHSS